MRLPHLALVGVLGLGLVACSSDEPTERDDTQAQSKVIQPGRPGEGNETVDPETVEEPAANESDVAFMQMRSRAASRGPRAPRSSAWPRGWSRVASPCPTRWTTRRAGGAVTTTVATTTTAAWR